MKTYQDKTLLKRNLIKKLTFVKYWLEKYYDKEDTLNKLYYIILIYINNDQDLIDMVDDLTTPSLIQDVKKLSKYAQKIQKQEFISDTSKTEMKKKIFNFFINNKIEIFKDILIYDKNFNYFDKIKQKHNLYFDRFDLEIRFLPNFLKYDYIIILVWILFCKAKDKKNTNNLNYFLHDIYLFQNEINSSIIKINYLIMILDKITNYIQFFDYDKK